MNKDYIIPDNWSIIEEGFDVENVEASESLFSIGNGAMGQRANFEEHYSGNTFQGSYIAGVYYPDKTRVGWWKNGYPEYFAKVLNAPSWIGIDVNINKEQLDLFACKKVENFKRELNMKEGWLSRSFKATLQNNNEIKVEAKRFLSLNLDEVGAIEYSITPLNSDVDLVITPYIDAGIKNEDSNWDDQFWNISNLVVENNAAFIEAQTMKTNFHTCTFMQSECFVNDQNIGLHPQIIKTDNKISFIYKVSIKQKETFTIHKFGGYTVGRNHNRSELIEAAEYVLAKVRSAGFAGLLEQQKQAWENIWKMADITIEGDVKAQQAIRFNIFQLNQTYPEIVGIFSKYDTVL